VKYRIVRPWPVAGRVIENGTVVDLATDTWAKGKIPPDDAIALDDECFRVMSRAYPKGTPIAFDRTYEVDDKVRAWARSKLR
jgi:hypothetical protein